MKKFLALVTAASALVTVPAAAQNWNTRGAVSFDTRIAQLEQRLFAGINAGLIDRQEERSLRWQIRDLHRLRNQYSYNGMTQQERWELNRRIRDTRQQMRMADNGRFDRDSRYGYWDDRYYGQGGPYRTTEACRERGGLSGMFDDVFSRDRCLRVGDVAPRGLGSVPYQYRSGFPDSSGIFYRSDGRAIYEIDARTNTVVGVYSMD